MDEWRLMFLQNWQFNSNQINNYMCMYTMCVYVWTNVDDHEQENMISGMQRSYYFMNQWWINFPLARIKNSIQTNYMYMNNSGWCFLRTYRWMIDFSIFRSFWFLSLLLCDNWKSGGAGKEETFETARKTVYLAPSSEAPFSSPIPSF